MLFQLPAVQAEAAAAEAPYTILPVVTVTAAAEEVFSCAARAFAVYVVMMNLFRNPMLLLFALSLTVV